MVDVPQLLRPVGSAASVPLDVDDIRRRVRRRRRSRAVTAVAALILAIPVAASSIPAPRTRVDLGRAAPPASEVDASPSVTTVLASVDMAFTPTDPAASAISRAAAVQTAQRRSGATVHHRSAFAVHGTVIDESQPASPRAVWAVRFRAADTGQRGKPRPVPPGGVIVVLLNAADGSVVATVGLTDPGAEQQGAAVEESLGAGGAGGATPAQPMRALGRGRTPRLAALDASAARGRQDSRVRSVLFIAATDTRVLVEDSTGCWVYAAVLDDGTDSWRATGGSMPCDP